MGCGSSKDEADLMELAPRRAAGGHVAAEPDLSRQELETALSELAQLCSQKSKHIRLVAAGGAVNTLFIKSRQSTHDIDIIDELVPAKDKQLLSQFAKQVGDRRPNFTKDWLNNKTVVFLPPDLRGALADEAVRQGAIIFRQPGLTIYAAPWKYAFISKIDRLSGMMSAAITTNEHHDAPDAAHYLRYIMQADGRNVVSMSDIQRWQQRYRLPTRGGMEIACSAVNEAYQRSFGSRPITS